MNARLSAEVREYFRKTYGGVFPPGSDQFERHFEQTIKVELSEMLFRQVRNVSGLSRAQLLDIGCGFGTFVLVCRQHGYQAWGLDTAEYELRFALRRTAPKAVDSSADKMFHQASASALPFSHECFDIVTLWNVLEHVPNYRIILREADRVLKPGGWLFGIAPNYLALREEAHYHVRWWPLLPKPLASRYLRWLGRDPTFLLNHVYYTTNLGVLGYLRKMGYRILPNRVQKVRNPGLCLSPQRARQLQAATRLKLSWLLAGLLYVDLWNPFRKAIEICAQKPMDLIEQQSQQK